MARRILQTIPADQLHLKPPYVNANTCHIQSVYPSCAGYVWIVACTINIHFFLPTGIANVTKKISHFINGNKDKAPCTTVVFYYLIMNEVMRLIRRWLISLSSNPFCLAVLMATFLPMTPILYQRLIERSEISPCRAHSYSENDWGPYSPTRFR